MTFKETLKQTHIYAKPVILKILGFNILFYISIMFFLGFGSIILPAAKHFGISGSLSVILLIVSIIAIVLGLLFMANSVLAKLEYILKHNTSNKQTWGTLWKNVYRLKLRNINLFALFGIVFILFSVGIIAIASNSNTTPNSNGELPIQIEIILLACGLIFNLIIIPIFFISAIDAICKENSAITAIKNACRLVFKRFIRLSIIPLGVIFVPTILLGMVFGLIGIPETTAESILYLLVLILESYFLSYYLVNYLTNSQNNTDQ